MSSAALPNSDPSTEASAPTSGGQLLGGILVMLLINIVQRIVGLLRGLGFCHFLSDDQLGVWALANSFFVLGVPVALLGLAGGFSRFTAYYQKQGQFGDYVFQVIRVAGIGLGLTLAWMLLFSGSFNHWVFHEAQSLAVTLWLASAFLTLVVFSVIYELVTGFQHVRTMSVMQFVQSVSFALIGLPLLAITKSWQSLLPSFAIANVLASLPGLYILWKDQRPNFKRSHTLNTNSMWMRILPYAASLWLISFLSNLFEVSDRYMLLHLHLGGVEQAQAAIGQYHCGRVLPNLVGSVALMLGGVLLPFMSADWEAGKHVEIASRMRLLIKMVVLILIAISVGILVSAPFLFHYVLGGRYAAAYSILPMTLLHAVWLSVFLVAESYFLCAERGRDLAIALVLGLVINCGLNWYCILNWGLEGAVFATTLSSLLVLGFVYWKLATLQCPLGWRTALLTLTPLSILLSPFVATLCLLGLVVVAGRTNWLFDGNERAQLDALLIPKLQKMRLPIETLWPK